MYRICEMRRCILSFDYKLCSLSRLILMRKRSVIILTRNAGKILGSVTYSWHQSRQYRLIQRVVLFVVTLHLISKSKAYPLKCTNSNSAK